MSRFQEINGHCGHLTIEIIELHAMPLSERIENINQGII